MSGSSKNDMTPSRNKHVVIAYNTCWYVYMFRLPLIRALLREGWKVTVLAPRDGYTDKVIASGAGHRHIDLEARGTNPLSELAAIQRFKKAYRELDPAVVLQFTIKPDIYGSIAARSTGVAVINTITGLGTMFSGGLKETLIRLLYRYAFARADLVLFQNQDDRELFVKSGTVRADHTGLLPGSAWIPSTIFLGTGALAGSPSFSRLAYCVRRVSRISSRRLVS